MAHREQRRLLLEPDGRPRSGQWSFDAENRARLPACKPGPALPGLTPRPR